MSVKSRISEIVAKFRAEGVENVEKGAKRVDKSLDGVGKSAQEAAQKIEKADKAGAGFGSRIARGAATAGRALASLARRAATTSAAVAAIGGAKFGGILAKSIDRTLESMTQLRRVTSLTRLPPEFVSFFERFGAESGLDKADTAAIFSGFSAAVGEAAADAESQFAKTFASIGIGVKDAQGRMKSLAALFAELARAQKRAAAGQISQAQFDYALNQFFGDDDALKVSELLTRMNELGPVGIQAKYQQAKAGGTLVTAEDVKEAKRLQAAVEGIKVAFDTVARSISTKSGKSVSDVLDGLSRVLERNAGRIGTFFRDQFDRTVSFVRDLVKAFTGYDFFKEIFPTKEIDYAYPVVLKIRDAFFAARDAVAAFGRDLSTIYDRLAGNGDANPFLETFAGGKLSAGITAVQAFAQGVIDSVQAMVDGVQARIQGMVDYVRDAWAEAQEGFDTGAGITSMSNSLAMFFLELRQIYDLIARFSQAFKAVFVDGMAAPQGFEWMTRVREILTEIDALLQKLGEAYTGFAKPIIDGIDRITEALTGMKSSVALLGFVLLNAFTAGILFKGIGALIRLVGSATGLAGAFAGAGSAATVMGTTAGAAATAAGAAATTASTAAATAATVAARAAITAMATLAAQVAVFAASAYAAYQGFDWLLGDYVAKRNDAATADFVDRAVRPAMNASLDRYGDKRTSAAAADQERAGRSPTQMSGGYDMSGYQGVADVRTAQFDRPTYATDALSSFEDRQQRFDLSAAQIDAANVAIDGNIQATVDTIDARNAKIVTNLQPIAMPNGLTLYGPAGTTADDLQRAARLRTTGR